MTKSLTALSAMLCAVALMGCPRQPDKAPDKSAGVEKCTQSPVLLAGDDKCDRTRCRLTVDRLDSGKLIVSPYKLVVGKDDKDVTIVWRLKNPAKYEFTEADGPKDLKNENSGGHEKDFSDGAPTDDDDGATKKANGKNYRIKYSNATPSQQYRYRIQITDKGDKKVYTCDPLINNAGN